MMKSAEFTTPGDNHRKPSKTNSICLGKGLAYKTHRPVKHAACIRPLSFSRIEWPTQNQLDLRFFGWAPPDKIIILEGLLRSLSSYIAFCIWRLLKQ